MQLEMISKPIIQDRIIYSLQEDENTASIIGHNSINDNIIIPRSIIHDTKEYIITSISDNAFNTAKMKSIQFASDSELQTIEKDAFYNSTIDNITIPSSLIKIGEKSFSNSKIKKFQIPKNSELRIIDKQAFSFSTIESFTVPPSLIHIGEKASQYNM